MALATSAGCGSRHEPSLAECSADPKAVRMRIDRIGIAKSAASKLSVGELVQRTLTNRASRLGYLIATDCPG